MPNSFTNIQDKILARGLLTLRELSVMPRLVNSDYSLDAAKKGTTIDVPIPTAVGVQDVTPSNVLPVPVDRTPGLVQIPLDKWKKNDPFAITDKERVEIDANRHYLPMTVQEAIRGLANQVNSDIFANYRGVYGYVGTAGTTPFTGSPGTVAAAVEARRVLNTQRCPRESRRAVLDFTAEAAALSLAEFADLQRSGDSGVRIEGEVGRKYGVDWYADDNVPFHTAGTGSGYLVNNGAGVAVGATTIPVDTGTGTLIVGDILTFANHTQTYTVVTALTGGNVVVSPAVVTAVPDNTAITRANSHRVNLMFHRDAFAYASRPLEEAAKDFPGSENQRTMQDPVTGVILRLEVIRQYKQVMWEFDILYGSRLVRPELACRIAG